MIQEACIWRTLAGADFMCDFYCTLIPCQTVQREHGCVQQDKPFTEFLDRLKECRWGEDDKVPEGTEVSFGIDRPPSKTWEDAE